MNQKAPDLINHSPDPEQAEEGYRSDDLVSEMDGDEYMESLEKQMAWEVGFLKGIRGAEQPNTLGVLMRDISDKEWKKAESEEESKILRQRSVKT